MFSRVARRYDLLNHLLSLGLDFAWRRRLARELEGLGPGDLLADLCAGTGDVAFAARRRVPGLRVLALDFTPQMAWLGAGKAARRGARGITFAIADALRLPLAGNSAAAVSVAFGIRNVGSLERALAEMVRVARPGGKVLILEFTQPEGALFGPLYLFYLRSILPLIARVISWTAGDAYRYLPQSIRCFAGSREMAQRMEAAGLQQVRAQRLALGAVHLYVGVKSGAR